MVFRFVPILAVNCRLKLNTQQKIENTKLLSLLHIVVQRMQGYIEMRLIVQIQIHPQILKTKLPKVGELKVAQHVPSSS